MTIIMEFEAKIYWAVNLAQTCFKVSTSINSFNSHNHPIIITILQLKNYETQLVSGEVSEHSNPVYWTPKPNFNP